MICFPDQDGDDFNIFVFWAYHGSLPADLFQQLDHDVLLRVDALYTMADELDAQTFKDNLMDELCRFAFTIRYKGHSMAHAQAASRRELEHTRLYDYLLQRNVWRVIETEGTNFSGIDNVVNDLQGLGESSSLYKDLLFGLLKLKQNHSVNPVLQSGHAWYEHGLEGRGTCSSWECREIENGLINAKVS